VTPDPRELLPVAHAAIDAAVNLIRGSQAATVTVTEKADRDLVSDVDIAVERAVREYLHQATPDIGFLGEEEGGPDDPGTGWIWALDPIDGTSNFAHGIPLCATSLALMRDGLPVLGVIDAPFLGERFHAAQGQGAWSGDRRLAASGTTALHEAIVAIGDYATGPGAARKNETQLAATVQLTPRVHRIRMLGTAALDLAWVAAGRLDASITFSNEPWDTAAGVIIAREAGAAITDSDGTLHALASTATIAAAAPLIPQLIPLLQAASTSHEDKQDNASPYGDLDGILSHARYLLFDFDGPVRDMSSEMPAGYIYEALAACRDSGRVPAVIAAADPEAASAYLARNGLDDQVHHLTAVNGGQPGDGWVSAGLIQDALRELDASPPDCALITATAATVQDARDAGLATIGYAISPETGQRLTEANADSLLLSLADLTLRLRARPLPN
jgi:myo-inositol-1(or 4)-monophosphatase